MCTYSVCNTQISKVRHALKNPKFASLQGITTLRSYDLQGI